MLEIDDFFRQTDRNGDDKVDLKELQKKMGKSNDKKAAQKDAVKFLHEVSTQEIAKQEQDLS
jgi:hypothetical protein